MVLETERLILRPFKDSDTESIYEYAKDPRVGPIAGWPVHTSVENSREIIRNVLAVPFWRQGLIPEAMKELIRHAFNDLNLDRLWCGYYDGNEKSKRCQEKCGFEYHHTNKDIHWELMDDIRTEHITTLGKDRL